MTHPRRAASTTPVRNRGTGRASSPQAHSVLVLSTVMVLLAILFYLWPQMRLVELGYQQNALRTQRAQALQRQKELQVELASLSRLSRIERIAVQKLGMRSPKLSQVVYIHAGWEIRGVGNKR